uniref:Uncharacterized protein n=1 Tax=Rhizophora mucronata TaxID=61149 RepID=A0A2P2PB81_RHIMU
MQPIESICWLTLYHFADHINNKECCC